jgi:ferredoxin
MPELFFVNEDKKINVDVGGNLREAAIASEIGVYSNIFTKLFNCRGNGICGTCVVKIERAITVGVLPYDIDPPNEIEKKKLKKKLDSDPNLRLACQLNVQNDLKIYTT